MFGLGFRNTGRVVNVLLGIDFSLIVVAVASLLVHMLRLYSYPVPLPSGLLSYSYYGLVIERMIVFPQNTSPALITMVLFLVSITPSIVLSWILSFFTALGRIKGYKRFDEDWGRIKFMIREGSRSSRLVIILVAVILTVLYPLLLLSAYNFFGIFAFKNLITVPSVLILILFTIAITIIYNQIFSKWMLKNI